VEKISIFHAKTFVENFFEKRLSVRILVDIFSCGENVTFTCCISCSRKTQKMTKCWNNMGGYLHEFFLNVESSRRKRLVEKNEFLRAHSFVREKPKI
jgi:hypothetical protein